MKAWNIILKIVVALAAIAGIVYLAATYGDKIVAWSKKMLARLGCICEDCGCCCDCEGNCENCDCECECDDCDCDCCCDDELTEEIVEEPAAEEPAEEPAVTAADQDFEG